MMDELLFLHIFRQPLESSKVTAILGGMHTLRRQDRCYRIIGIRIKKYTFRQSLVNTGIPAWKINLWYVFVQV